MLYCAGQGVGVKKRDLLSISDLSPQEVRGLLGRALELKQGAKSACLAGKILVWGI